MKNWNIKQYQEDLQKNLALCHTQLERDCCKAIGGKEIREIAYSFAAVRKLTSGERAIAEQYGYKDGLSK